MAEEYKAGTHEWELEQEKIINKAIAGLMEHYDSVHIFITKRVSVPDEIGGVTFSKDIGAGNWYARWGQIVEHVMAIKRRIQRDVDRGICEQEEEDEDG